MVTFADADECASNPCQNGGVCSDHKKLDTLATARKAGAENNALRVSPLLTPQ